MTPAQQLNAKLRLERALLGRLSKYHQSIVKEFMREYGARATVPDLEPRNAQLSAILNDHYTAAAETFTPVIEKALPDDVPATSQEKAALAAALAVFFTARAEEQASIINGTTQEEMGNAAAAAIATEPSLLEASALAGAVLTRNLMGRATSIAATETQAAAEASKLTATDVLLGRAPSIQGGTAAPAESVKDWWTVGDSHVRSEHLAADGQSVPVSAPFVVGGEQLMYPGDTSLGASLDNVINCRCIAEYDTAAIAEERRARL